ncbi:hypothetical protein Hdeb2414_s0033g00718761 [Helianthus debilis subsp. tardiflorus]
MCVLEIRVKYTRMVPVVNQNLGFGPYLLKVTRMVPAVCILYTGTIRVLLESWGPNSKFWSTTGTICVTLLQ